MEDFDSYKEGVEARERLARHVVVVGEFADLPLREADGEASLNRAQRLCVKARVAGTHHKRLPGQWIE